MTPYNDINLNSHYPNQCRLLITDHAQNLKQILADPKFRWNNETKSSNIYPDKHCHLIRPRVSAYKMLLYISIFSYACWIQNRWPESNSFHHYHGFNSLGDIDVFFVICGMLRSQNHLTTFNLLRKFVVQTYSYYFNHYKIIGMNHLPTSRCCFPYHYKL